MEITLHTHKLHEPDPNFCSCCRKAIISGQQNVVRITEAPEKILNLKGEKIGEKGQERVKAYYHVECFSNHTNYSGRIECKYCGILCVAKVLKDGTPISSHCKCSCHAGQSYCSLVLL